MLRNAVLAAAILWAGVAVVMFAMTPASWPMLAMAMVALLGTAGERVHYRGNRTPGAAGHWARTAERFRDEVSGRPVTVWFNATTGERCYVEDGETPPGH